MTKAVVLSIFGSVAFLALVGACLFASAWRLDLTSGRLTAAKMPP